MFDGVHFESIEKLTSFSQIDKLKKAYELKDEIKWNNQIKSIEKQSPQLIEFIQKNQKVFEKYFTGDNNALLSLINTIISTTINILQI